MDGLYQALILAAVALVTALIAVSKTKGARK